jgi:hypothetical protein
VDPSIAGGKIVQNRGIYGGGQAWAVGRRVNSKHASNGKERRCPLHAAPREEESMLTELISILVLGIFVIATTLPINMEALAFAVAFLVGIFAAGLTAGARER